MSTTFGSVEKMLQGKKYPQNIRALRLLTEELLRPAFEKENARLTSMGDLEDVLDELSAQSRATKMWVNNVIKPTFPMMRFCRATGLYISRQLKLWWPTCLLQTSITTVAMASTTCAP